ncbi:SU10 major capsid protein [Paenibacillus albidus]|uniref:SU10 major capsid protein n=1 Tax=Paenibacillus albidus TaxID=2041023 RepID=UPI00288C5D50|nr:DUF5309 family protein [Paenibacillus albidus]
MTIFTSDKFLPGQSVDMKDIITQTTPIITPFSTMMLNKTVRAEAPKISWIEEALDESSAVTLPEGGDAPEFVEDDTELLDNFCELLAATATVSNTAQASTAVGIGDLLAKEVSKKTQSLKLRLENVLINGTKGYSTTTKTYTTGGILEQIHTSNRLTAATPTQAEFENLLSKMYHAGTNYDMTVFLPANLKTIVNTFDSVTYLARDKFLGFDMEIYSSVYGQVKFILSEKLQNKMFVVNPNYLELATLIPFHGTPQPLSGSKQSVFLEGQYGLKLLNRKAAASLTIA